MAALGFSINTLSMFGMVLAIGLLVDDAIVVVENVERVMREEGLSPRDATRKAMGQSAARWSGLDSSFPPFLCRWRSLADRSARFTGSSRSPLSARWRFRCLLRCF